MLTHPPLEINRGVPTVLDDPLATHTVDNLIPKCCACKKTRDKAGKWRQAELAKKVSKMFQFTHTYCPECARNLFPDYI